jgi:hypothetical protein
MRTVHAALAKEPAATPPCVASRSPRSRSRSGAEGFTLAEVLIAAALTLAVSGAALGLMNQMRAALEGQTGRVDLQQRARVAASALERDLLSAGAGVSAGTGAGPLVWFVPPVVPYRRGQVRDDSAARVFYRPDTLSVMFVPPTRAQARVRSAAVVGPTLVVEVAPNCGPGWHDRLCGFTEGMRVLILDPSGAHDVTTVSRVDGARVVLLLGGAPAVRYDDGRAVLAEVSADTYYLDPGVGAETPRLMHYDGFLTDRPVVDHVVSLGFEYFGDPAPPEMLEAVSTDPARGPRTTYGPRPPAVGIDDLADTWAAGENCLFSRVAGAWMPRLGRLAVPDAPVALSPASLQDGPWCADATARGRYDADLLRVRRVRVHLRVQAAAPAFRGPAGRLFARAGLSTSIERFVPDLRMQFDVAPRNLNLGR